MSVAWCSSASFQQALGDRPDHFPVGLAPHAGHGRLHHAPEVPRRRSRPRMRSPRTRRRLDRRLVHLGGQVALEHGHLLAPRARRGRRGRRRGTGRSTRGAASPGRAAPAPPRRRAAAPRFSISAFFSAARARRIVPRRTFSPARIASLRSLSSRSARPAGASSGIRRVLPSQSDSRDGRRAAPSPARVEGPVQEPEERQREGRRRGDVPGPRAHHVEQAAVAPAARAGTCSCRRTRGSPPPRGRSRPRLQAKTRRTAPGRGVRRRPHARKHGRDHHPRVGDEEPPPAVVGKALAQVRRQQRLDRRRQRPEVGQLEGQRRSGARARSIAAMVAASVRCSGRSPRGRQPLVELVDDVEDDLVQREQDGEAARGRRDPAGRPGRASPPGRGRRTPPRSGRGRAGAAGRRAPRGRLLRTAARRPRIRPARAAAEPRRQLALRSAIGGMVEGCILHALGQQLLVEHAVRAGRAGIGTPSPWPRLRAFARLASRSASGGRRAPSRSTRASASSMARVRRVRLGRERDVGRRLGEVDARLGQPDELDRARGRHGHLQRARVGVAHVLAGGDDQAPRDVLRVLAAGRASPRGSRSRRPGRCRAGS